MGANVTHRERWLDQVLSELGVIVWRAEPEERRFTFVSDGAGALLGYAVGRWLDEPGFWIAHLYPGDREEVLARHRDAVARGTDHQLKYRMLAADGRTVWLRDIVRVLPGSGGRLAELRGVTIDVTGTRTPEAPATAVSDEAPVAGRLAGVVADDLGSLLTTILGYAEMLLLQVPPGDERRRDLERIREAAERAPDVLRPLLAFAGSERPGPRRLDVGDMVRGMAPALRRLVAGRTELVVSIPPAGLPAATAGPGQLESCVLALAAEAGEDAGADGKVLVEVSAARLDQAYARRRESIRPGAYVTVAVTVTPRLAGRTGHSARMAGAFGLARRNGWGVWTYDEGGLGRTIKLYLPSSEALESVAEAPSFVPEAGTAVLLVEDDRAVRGHVRKALAALGLSVLEARDGLEATRIADRRARIDLLVTDLVLPGLGGAEVARRLTVARRDLRVLYLSGYTETVLGLRGWLPRGAPFLEKPFSLDTLIRKVTALLAAPSGR